MKAERAAERASRPKKVKPKKDDYEVEAIKGQLYENCCFLRNIFSVVNVSVNDHLIEFHLIEIVIFQLIEISLIT